MIVLEGIDGAGKSQLTRALSTKTVRGTSIFTTQEPTDGLIGTLLRKYLDSSSHLFSPRTAAYLFAADRYEHLHGSDGILSKNDTSYVLIDRYIFSSFAYQGLNVGYKVLWDLNREFPFPETLIYLDLPIEVAWQRIRKNRMAKDHFETIALLEKIKERYEEILRLLEDSEVNILRIQADIPPERLAEVVIQAL